MRHASLTLYLLPLLVLSLGACAGGQVINADPRLGDITIDGHGPQGRVEGAHRFKTQTTATRRKGIDFARNSSFGTHVINTKLASKSGYIAARRSYRADQVVRAIRHLRSWDAAAATEQNEHKYRY